MEEGSKGGERDRAAAGAAPEISEPVRRLMAQAPVFDAHMDSIGRAVDLGADLGEPSELGHFDLPRGARGGLGAWVVVTWVDPEAFAGRAFERAKRMLESTHALAALHPDRFRVVTDAAELERARSSGCSAGIPGIEGGHAIEDSLERLRWFHAAGVRVMTLVWNNHLSWIRSCQPGAGREIPKGLSSFGRGVVQEMNRLGMVVDLSHAGERSFFDALEAGSAPPIASHSGCRALHDYPRNLTDDQLRALAECGGVVGIVFHPGFLDAEARVEEFRVRAADAYRAVDSGDPALDYFTRQQVMRREAAPMPAARLVEHILHAVEVAGIEHVGIGSDYDGIERGPEWLEDASCYGVLAQLLVDRGLALQDVERILGGNMRRVFAEVTGRTGC